MSNRTHHIAGTKDRRHEAQPKIEANPTSSNQSSIALQFDADWLRELELVASKLGLSAAALALESINSYITRAVNRARVASKIRRACGSTPSTDLALVYEVPSEPCTNPHQTTLEFPSKWTNAFLAFAESVNLSPEDVARFAIDFELNQWNGRIDWRSSRFPLGAAAPASKPQG